MNVCVDGCAGSGVASGVAGHGDDVMASAGQAGHQRRPTKPDAPATSTFTAATRPAPPRSLGRPPAAGTRGVAMAVVAGSGEGERGAPGQ